MTATMPEVCPEGRYNATQTAKALGVSRMTLNRWVRANKILPRVCRANERPRFLGRDIISLWRRDY